MDTVRTPVVEPRRPRRGRSIAGPVILIGLGLLILAQNLGLLSTDSWATLSSLWPVLLILVGVELVLGRGSWVGAIVISILVLVVLGFAAFAWTFPWSTAAPRGGPFVVVETIEMAEELGRTKQATYNVEYGAGNLAISALSLGSGSLVEGTLERDDRATIEKRVDRQGDQSQVVVRGRNTSTVTVGSSSGHTRMTLKLSPQVSSSLVIEGGAGDSYLDLRDLRVTSLNVSSGVGAARVVLPQSAGRMTAKVSSGVGGVEITVPQGVAARIKVDTGLGSARIDTERFRRIDDHLYQSSEYDAATNRVDLQISAGVGGITVK